MKKFFILIIALLAFSARENPAHAWFWAEGEGLPPTASNEGKFYEKTTYIQIWNQSAEVCEPAYGHENDSACLNSIASCKAGYEACVKARCVHQAPASHPLLLEDDYMCSADDLTFCASQDFPKTYQVATHCEQAWPGTLCGSGTLEDGETCDDGNKQDGDGCSGSCAVEPAYSCQNSELSQPSTCSLNQGCGNGVVEAGEVCDDGAKGACSTDCQAFRISLIPVTVPNAEPTPAAEEEEASPTESEKDAVDSPSDSGLNEIETGGEAIGGGGCSLLAPVAGGASRWFLAPFFLIPGWMGRLNRRK